MNPNLRPYVLTGVIIIILAALSITETTVLLATRPHAPDVPGSHDSVETWNRGVVTYTDPTTGCEYIARQGIGGLNPRISNDGVTQRGCKNNADAVSKGSL